jgi:5'(3')-deoxyribonucleotidase
MKVIAIDIDDTLNNYSEILRRTDFPYDDTYPISADKFAKYLEMVRTETAEKDDLLNPEFSFVRQSINGQCYELAGPRAGAVELLQWLDADGWRIVICTQRDLRRTEQATRKWLGDNAIPFGDLFIAVDKLGFCKDWGIEYLVDDHLYSVRFADEYGIKVFYPIMPKHEGSESRLAKGFTIFDQVRQWIQGQN